MPVINLVCTSKALRNAGAYVFADWRERRLEGREKKHFFIRFPAAGSFFIRICTDPDKDTKLKVFMTGKIEIRMQRVWLCEEKTQVKGRFFMRKLCLALLVLALTIPTMGAVNITLTRVGDTNQLTLGFTSDAEVRAFAFDVTVTDAALLTSTITRVGGADANYYVTPTNVGFTTIGNVLRPWPYNSPAVDANASKFTVEMGSLYASNDPCSAHKFPPPLTGNLVTFYVAKAKRGADNQITVTVTQANAKRGKVVLKGPPVTSVDPVLPAAVVLQWECMQVGEKVGGVQIGAAEYANWITLNKPLSWCHPGHYLGDANLDCVIDTTDLFGVNGDELWAYMNSIGASWPDANYAPSDDCNNDLVIDTTDYFGWSVPIAQEGLVFGLLEALVVPPPCSQGVLP